MLEIADGRLMRRLSRLGAFLPLLWSCAESGWLSESSVAIVDSAGATIVTTNSGDGLWTEETRWELREFLRLGNPVEPVEELFSGPTVSPSIGPDGNIYVLDRQAARLSIFTPDGTFVRTFGRRGRGPSDLLGPGGLTWAPDGAIWIADAPNRKYAVFEPDGSFRETYPRAIRATARIQWPMVYLDSVGIIDEAAANGQLVLLRTTPDGQIHDTAALVDRTGGASEETMSAFARRPGPEFTTVGRYFAGHMKWALDPAGAVWVAPPDSLRFYKLSLEGDTLVSASATHRSNALTRQDERLIGEALGQSGLDRSQMVLRKPLIRSLHVLDSGHLLVQIVERPGIPSGLFDVYDPVGRYLGELDFGFAPTVTGVMGSRGDTIVVPTLGRLDVPYIVGLEIRRPGGLP